jgi:hypothetical protein
MKFTKLVVLAACAAPAASFVTPQYKIRTAFKPLHALEDLEAKLLEDKPSKAAAARSVAKPSASKPAAKKSAAPVEKLELPSYDSFAPSPAPKVAEKPKPVKVEKPKPAPKPRPVPPPRPAPAPKPVAVQKPKPPPPVKKVSPPKPPKAPERADPNAVPIGLALGAAPLLLAPVALLGAGRSALSGTVARREKIQTEIAKKEAAARKKKLQSELDGNALTGAVVRTNRKSEEFSSTRRGDNGERYFGLHRASTVSQRALSLVR